jgi:competence protein ComEC
VVTGAGLGELAGASPVRHDLRLVAPALGAWGCAMAAPSLPRWPAAAAALLAFGLAATLLVGRWLRADPRRRPVGTQRRRLAGGHGPTVAATLACSAAGLLVALASVTATAAGPLPALARDGATVTVEAVVTTDPRAVRAPTAGDGARGPMYAVGVRVEEVTARGRTSRVRSPVVVLAAAPEWRDLLPGTRVRAAGRLTLPRDGTVTALLSARRDPVVVRPAGPVQRAAGELRSGLRAAADDLPPGERGLVPGLVVGDTSNIPPDLEEDFRTAGLTHLVAVSGANVAIVCGAVLLVVRRLGAGTRLATVFAAVALAGFVVLARPQPSVLRAGVMGAIGLAALAAGRRGAAVPALAAAVLALVLVEPTLARSYGFALSVVATPASCCSPSRGPPRCVVEACPCLSPRSWPSRPPRS